jgi:hypothetical protein
MQVVAWQRRLWDALIRLPNVSGTWITTSVAGERGDLVWRRLAKRCCALARADIPVDAVIVDATETSGDEFDVVIDLSGDPLVGGWDCRFGVWSLTDGRGRQLSFSYPGIESIAAGKGGHVQVSRRSKGAACILREGRFAAGPSYQRSFARQYAVAAGLTCQSLVDLVNGITSGFLAPVDVPAPVPSHVNGLYLLWGNWLSLRDRLHSIFLSESWMLGIIEAPIHALLDSGAMPDVRWIGKRMMKRYFADPFGFPGSGQLLCEEFDEDSAIGTIKELTVSENDIVAERKVVFPTMGHLSYPYLFEDGGKLYCIPEACASRRCDLYSKEDGGNWQLVGTLLKDVAAADPTIFRWNGLYWLAYTDNDSSPFDNLCLHYAERLEGPWQAHSNNPVKVDHRSSRPAGSPFVVDGRLYRPAQVCAEGYGTAVSICEVEICTPREFREREVKTIYPVRSGRNPHGLHTISAWGNRVLVDGKRLIFNPVVLRRKIMRRFCAMDY